MELTSRVATAADVDGLRTIMDSAISELQKGFLTDQQIEASRAIMGIDNQLIVDGTYYVVEHDGVIAGCGGGGAAAQPCTAATPLPDATRTCSTPPSTRRECERCTRILRTPAEVSDG